MTRFKLTATSHVVFRPVHAGSVFHQHRSQSQSEQSKPHGLLLHLVSNDRSSLIRFSDLRVSEPSHDERETVHGH